ITGGGGTNTFNVGSANDNTGTLDGIRGELNINGLAGGGITNSLVVNDRGKNTAQTYEVWSNYAGRSSRGAWYTNMKNVTLYGGTGANTINAYSPSSAPTGATATTVYAGNAGTNTNTINVRSQANTLDNLPGKLTINGGTTGTNNLLVDDSGKATAQNYEVWSNYAGRSNGVAVWYNNIQNLTLKAASGGKLIPASTTLTPSP